MFIKTQITLICFLIRKIFLVEVVYAIQQKNSIILVIPDGTGSTILEAARLVEYGDAGDLSVKSLHEIRLLSTQTSDFHRTDSAAAGTAIATGVRTLYYRVGTGQDGEVLLNFPEYLKKQFGNLYKIGIIAKVNPGDATPAVFQAHVIDRNDMNAVYENIAQNTQADLVLGANHSNVQPILEKLQDRGFMTFDFDDYQLNNKILEETNLPYFGIVSTETQTQMLLDMEDNYIVNPTLQYMTKVAIEKLSNNFSNPFFLMVEASLVDDQLHSSDIEHAIGEAIEYDHLIKYIRSVVDTHPEVHLLTTADHETGGVVLPSDLKALASLPVVNQSGSISEQNKQRRDRITKLGPQQYHSDHTNAYVMFGGYGQMFARHQLDLTKMQHIKDVNQVMKDIVNYVENAEKQRSALLLAFGISGYLVAAIVTVVCILAVCKQRKQRYTLVNNTLLAEL